MRSTTTENARQAGKTEKRYRPVLHPGAQPTCGELNVSSVPVACVVAYLCGWTPFKNPRRSAEFIHELSLARRIEQWCGLPISMRDLKCGIGMYHRYASPKLYSLSRASITTYSRRHVGITMPRGVPPSTPWWLDGKGRVA